MMKKMRSWILVYLFIFSLFFSSCGKPKQLSFPCDQSWHGGGKNTQIDYSPDGKTLGVISQMCVFFINTKTWEPRFSFLSDYVIQSFSYAPNLEFFAMVSDHDEIYTIDPQSGEIINMTSADDAYGLIEISPDSKHLITNSLDGYLTVWSANKLETEFILDSGKYNTALVSLAFSPRGDLIAAGTNHGQILLWDFKSGQLINMIDAHEGWIGNLLITTDSSNIISASDDGFIKIWDVESSNLINSLDIFSYWGGFTDIALIDNDKQIIFLLDENRIGSSKIEGSNVFKIIHEFDDEPIGFSISPDEKYIAVDLFNGEIEIIRY